MPGKPEKQERQCKSEVGKNKNSGWVYHPELILSIPNYSALPLVEAMTVTSRTPGMLRR